MKSCANPSCGQPLPDGYGGKYCDNNNRCKQSALRARRRDPGLLERGKLAREAIRAGADPMLTLSLLVWPPETAEEARALLAVAA